MSPPPFQKSKPKKTLIQKHKPSSKERLDVQLVVKGLVPTRTKAQALILAGQVTVNGIPVRKSGSLVKMDQNIQIKSGPKFVSRGGDKLEGALKDFDLSPEGRVCLDVGSSTGGFTDCLLKRGATKVYAVDVGKGQLDLSLRGNPKVEVWEKTHILSFHFDQFGALPDFVVIDVSFISLKKILPHIKSLVPKGSMVLCLIKPQFETEPKFLKKGVVRSLEIQKKVVEGIETFSSDQGFHLYGHKPSCLKGPKGNQEYFLLLTT